MKPFLFSFFSLFPPPPLIPAEVEETEQEEEKHPALGWFIISKSFIIKGFQFWTEIYA